MIIVLLGQAVCLLIRGANRTFVPGARCLFVHCIIKGIVVVIGQLDGAHRHNLWGEQPDASMSTVRVWEGDGRADLFSLSGVVTADCAYRSPQRSLRVAEGQHAVGVL